MRHLNKETTVVRRQKLLIEASKAPGMCDAGKDDGLISTGLNKNKKRKRGTENRFDLESEKRQPLTSIESEMPTFERARSAGILRSRDANVQRRRPQLLLSLLSLCLCGGVWVCVAKLWLSWVERGGGLAGLEKKHYKNWNKKKGFPFLFFIPIFPLFNISANASQIL